MSNRVVVYGSQDVAFSVAQVGIVVGGNFSAEDFEALEVGNAYYDGVGNGSTVDGNAAD